MKKVKGVKMEYCSKCKNIHICKYTSEITDIENKVNELQNNSHIYTITLRCNYFESNPGSAIRTSKLSELNPIKEVLLR